MKKISLFVLAAVLLSLMLVVSCENNNELVTYTVTFDSVGGTAVKCQIVVKGDKAIAPENPTRDGYDFLYWITEGGNVFDFKKVSITRNITLHAVWDEDNGVYVITFDSDGGTHVDSQKVKEGEVVSMPDSPTKEGYHFRGWTLGEDNYYNFAGNAVASDLTLKANWSDAAGYCTVFFDSCGGSAVASQRVKQGGKVTKPEDPVYDGFQFDGWVKEDEYVSFDFDSETVTKNITLYADWSIKTYTVTFDSNGGSGVDKEVVVPGEKVSKPSDPVKAGYDFVGWLSSDNTFFSFDKEVVPGDITLRALWREYNGSYTVTFNSDGGSEVASQTVKKWGRITMPSEPTKEGYYFAYWMKTDGSVFDFENETVSADIELKAVWGTKKYYTVKFNVDGGSYVDTQRVREGDKIKTPVTTVKDGYEFQCWTDELDKEFSLNTPITYDVTLNAKWMMKYYDVVFDPNNGKETFTERVNVGGTVYKPKENPTKNVTDYQTFDYWSLDGKTEYNFNTPVNSSLTLKAVWRDYKVGDRGPAGGYIFYDCDADNNTGNNDGLVSSECGWRFLEAAANDLPRTMIFGTQSYDDWGTRFEIGTGKRNTEILKEKGGSICASYYITGREIDGYSDWFIPSRYELDQMYLVLHKNGLGNFRSDKYWSSSTLIGSAHNASYENFADGKITDHLRSNYDYIRPIRSF